MIHVLLALVIAMGGASSTPRTHTGYAAYYRKSMMEHVRDNRIEQGDITPDQAKATPCHVASPYYPVGTIVRVTYEDADALECLVIDIPQPEDKQSIIKRRIVVEVSYQQAKKWGCINKQPRHCGTVTIQEKRKETAWKGKPSPTYSATLLFFR